MRHHALNLTVAFLAVLTLFGCGGGGGGGGGNIPANSSPTANAGPNQTVASAATVTLNGSASTDSDGTIASYAWTQTTGLPAITLSGGTTAQPTFVAPSVVALSTYTFSLVVTDNRGASSTASTVTVTVNPPVAVNQPPTASAGTSQTVVSGVTVTLNGTGSLDPDGTIATYAWTQTAGTAVTLSNAAVAQPTFTAPTVVSAATLTFSLTVTDNSGAASAAATVNITVNPPVVGNVNVTGNVTFTRIPTSANGLNYAAPQIQASRGVLVRALSAGTATVLATATTSDTGAYSLSVPGNTSIDVVVVALMQRTGSLPNWNFRVQAGTGGNAPYTFTDGSFNSGAGTTHNLQIPSGFNAAGAVTGTRASAPFAVLDTVYRAVQTILGVAPTTNFPMLVLDWATTNPGGLTFFSSTDPNNVPLQNIVLSADVTEDTDEFDQHVIAHEFGHYIEFNFSRADNIGGSHGLGDKLDIRVAFGEGFGYAFAAIVLNDPVARDTFVNAGVGVTSTFNVETNPSTTPAGASPAGNYGCWCSESSVWSILWDIYDSAADTNDNVALGFAPMWSVLTTTQKTTPAVTSIFSFITALKAANAGQAAAINTLILAQNIDTNIDAFGSTETHRPNEVSALGALPIFANVTVGGGPVIVQSVNDTGGTFNNLGNHRFVKFDVGPGTRIVTISVSSANPTNPDPDFVLYRAGTVVTFGQSAPAPTETKTNISLVAATYVLDVYECANGCGGTGNGTAGSYALTVTVN